MIFFKEMAVARSIFTLGGWVQLFWTAFDMPVTGVPLEIALGWQNFFVRKTIIACMCIHQFG